MATGVTPVVDYEKKASLGDDPPQVNVVSPEMEKGLDAVQDTELDVTGFTQEEIEIKMSEMTVERTAKIIKNLYRIHENDQNFPRETLDKMQELLENPDILANPEKHPELMQEMKLEAVLATENSPYLEVRANVEPTDDPTMPSLTFRVFIIGSFFAVAGSFIDTLFGYRYPAVYIGANVAQLLAYPIGRFMHRTMPTRQFTTFGRKWSFNPGPFNKKEHMLITIMANVSFSAPYTNYIIPVQALPMFFNQSWARKYGYQILNTLGTNFIGYGLAGLTRRFLVYPSVAVWPSSLSIIGLNKAFHTTVNEPVKGPFGKVFTWSREKFFLISFAAMFFYFWLPGYLFQALSSFSWMTWIAPDNIHLNAVTGMTGGVGLNPWPTFDWNNLTVWLTPLTIPTFPILNMFVGILIGAIMCLIIWYKNAWNTGYMPINSNRSFDNTGKTFNVSRVLDANSNLDVAKYQQYSQPWMSAGYVVSFLWYFALYGATATYVAIYNRHECAVGFRALWKGFKEMISRKKADEEEDDKDDLSKDVHYRLRKNYKEVPEWQYLIVLLISMTIGMIGVGVYPTHTTPAVVMYGLIMPLIVMIPCGLIQAVTGIAVPLNVLAQFIGGAMVQGNANALMYFKTYGYITVYQALAFSSDLKLAHYIKIPPYHAFYMQLWATLIYSFVSSGVFNLAMSFKNVCTPQAAFKFSCPNQRTFFTSAIFWGTLSPNRLFGPGRRYNWMLIGFPIGVGMVLVYWGLRKRFPKSEFLRQVHPVMIAAGPSTWGSPYNMSYYIGNVYVVLVSFQWLRKKHTAFWAKYNYVVAASFPAAIAICSLVIFFCLQIPNGGYNISWWGNDVPGVGCEGIGGCPRLEVPEVGYFGLPPGSGKFT